MTGPKMEDYKGEILDYSIVIPVYYNEGALTETMRDVKNIVLDYNIKLKGEVIFVDDGSGDGSLKELLRLRSEYPSFVKVIKLSRNFGQIPALYAGFKHARGKCVITMSADGQDPATLINDMLHTHFNEGFEIVACERIGRDESNYRIVTSKIFYKLMKKLTFANMPEGGFDFVLISRRVLQIILRNQESYPFFQGQILWTGFKTKFIAYKRRKRKIGKSRWSFGKKITYLIDGVMAYSFHPIRLISLFGIGTALIGFFYALLIFLMRILGGIPVEGWAPLMIATLVVGGIQMIMLGIIGEYLWRTLAQVRNRDPYVIEAIFDETRL